MMPAGAAPFFPMYGGYGGYPPMAYPMYAAPMGPRPYVPPPSVPVDRPALLATIARQVDFYFSPQNLVRDMYLRQQMDSAGFVPVSLVLSFRRMATMCPDVPTLMEAMRSSTHVELNEGAELIRVRVGWESWLFPNPDGTYGRPLYAPVPSPVATAAEDSKAVAAAADVTTAAPTEDVTPAAAPAPAATTTTAASSAMSPPGGSASPPRAAIPVVKLDDAAPHLGHAHEALSSKLSQLAV